ncbi:MAG: hypothetical protein ACE366_05195 [Bradymonadia bacterium]
MYALLTILMTFSPVDVPCGGTISGEFDSPVHIRLAPQCTYREQVKITSSHGVKIEGGEGTRIEGDLAVERAPSVTISTLDVRSTGAALHLEKIGHAELQALRLRAGIDGVHVHQAGPIRGTKVSVMAPGTGIWVQGAESVDLADLHVEAGELAMVIRDVPGKVHIAESTLRVLPGSGTSAVFVSAEGPAEITGNTITYLGRLPSTRVAVLELDAEGRVADNRFVGMEVGVRARRSALVVGCNTFDGPWAEVDGRHERDCPLDLAPNALDWRARVGGRIDKNGTLVRSSPPEKVSANLP